METKTHSITLDFSTVNETGRLELGEIGEIKKRRWIFENSGQEVCLAKSSGSSSVRTSKGCIAIVYYELKLDIRC